MLCIWVLLASSESFYSNWIRFVWYILVNWTGFLGGSNYYSILARWMVQLVLESIEHSDRGKLYPTLTLNPLARGCGPWFPVDQLLFWHDRVSRVLTYLTGYRAKLELDRVEADWCSTTIPLSGRDRPQGLCILRGGVPSRTLGTQECGGLPS